MTLLQPRRTRDYVLRMPKDTTVKVACELVRCENWLHGWDTILDTRDPPKRAVAQWLRSGGSGRTFRELPGGGEVAVFRFEPHQRCFDEHRTRPARWLAGGQQRADMHEWIDDLDQHAGHLAEQAQKG